MLRYASSSVLTSLVNESERKGLISVRSNCRVTPPGVRGIRHGALLRVAGLSRKTRNLELDFASSAARHFQKRNGFKHKNETVSFKRKQQFHFQNKTVSNTKQQR